jgi:hypothetical protein
MLYLPLFIDRAKEFPPPGTDHEGLHIHGLTGQNLDTQEDEEGGAQSQAHSFVVGMVPLAFRLIRLFF